MINSLFSVFDPTSIGGELNWLMALVPLGLVISPWGSSNFSKKIFLKGILFVHMDLMLVRSKVYFWGQSMIFLVIFIELGTINFLGLFPFIFTPSSHLSFAFMLSIFLWFGSQGLSWITQTKSMLAHLVPEGTPAPLMPFLVLIELVSNLIRPLTLSIRLVANMSAGHLLLSLLGSSISLDNFWVMMIVMVILILFIILEVSVAFIQAYVFMSLSSLYVNEVE